MKKLILFFLLISYGHIFAQQLSTASPEGTKNLIQHYFTAVAEYSALYNGKMETPYDMRMKNHPYFLTTDYVKGDIVYNGAYYTDVSLRYDQYRDQLVARTPDQSYNVVLESPKVSEANLNGYPIVSTQELSWQNMPSGNYYIFLYTGEYTVFYKPTLLVVSSTSNRLVEQSFKITNRYYVTIDGVCHPVKNKSGFLKLFPDKRKELNQFAKQERLDFKNNAGQAFIALVKQYELLSK
ncbi:hypothetical protein LJC57_03715 [Parabacteroides sp. OttesenSCG-928-G07]|nr:hypothetical protein [Parabacteroides sp. OttesenSCG-928-G07]